MNIVPPNESRVVITGSLIQAKKSDDHSTIQLTIEISGETPHPTLDREQAVAVVLLDKPIATQRQAEQPHSLARQSGIHCSRQAFQRFLSEKLQRPIDNEQSAASAVREVCEVASRREFDERDAAARNWKSLRGEFQAWRIMG